MAVHEGIRGRHHQGRRHRGRQAASCPGRHHHRERQGQGAHPQVRSPGRSAGLHGRGGQEAGLRHAHTAGDRHLPWRENDAQVQYDDVRGLKAAIPSEA